MEKKATMKNIKEAEFRQSRQKIFKRLKGMIGIVTPYKSQVRALKNQIFRMYKVYGDITVPQEFIEINTVDAYQGREKDILIFSCVRASKERTLGFISDYRRMNVGITRAKYCLIVIGNSDTLNKDKNWRGLIEFCKDQNDKSRCYIEYKKDQNITTKPENDDQSEKV